MRITTQMMNNNSLTNINTNKLRLDSINNQLAAEKKIIKPSDDPIIAMRALKLRSNVAEVTQFYEKNTEDAIAWLTTTQDAVESTKNIITAMKTELTGGANGTHTAESRAAIAEELKALKNQIYANADADYAGRTLFTGFRTNSKITLSDAEIAKTDNGKIEYQDITEYFSASDIKDITYVSGKLDMNNDVLSYNTSGADELDVKDNKVARIRLAYNNLDSSFLGDVSAGMSLTTLDKAGNVTDSNAVTIKSRDADGDSCYKPGANDIILIHETGELILGNDIAAKLKALGPEEKMSFAYDKSYWEKGDLRPEFYFECYNKTEDKEYDTVEQDIVLDLSGNQSMKVNTGAAEVFSPNIGRDIDEIVSCIDEVNEASAKADKLTEMYNAASGTDKDKLKVKLDAAQKELSLVKDKLQRNFENKLTTFSSYLSQVTLAGTTIGTRIERIELIQNRLMDLKATSKELADSNENADLADLSVQKAEAETTYQAALMATGQISQQTLLSYI